MGDDAGERHEEGARMYRRVGAYRALGVPAELQAHVVSQEYFRRDADASHRCSPGRRRRGYPSQIYSRRVRIVANIDPLFQVPQ